MTEKAAISSFMPWKAPGLRRTITISRWTDAGYSPRRATFFLGRPRKKAKKPPRMPGPFGVRCGARLCRAAPNSLRYAPFRQGARSQTLMALRAARQILRSSPRQHGVTQNTNTPRCSGRAIEPAIVLAALVQEPLGMLCITQRGCVQCGPGWDARRILRPIARAIGNKCNAADRPGPR